VNVSLRKFKSIRVIYRKRNTHSYESKEGGKGPLAGGGERPETGRKVGIKKKNTHKKKQWKKRPLNRRNPQKVSVGGERLTRREREGKDRNEKERRENIKSNKATKQNIARRENFRNATATTSARWHLELSRHLLERTI